MKTGADFVSDATIKEAHLSLNDGSSRRSMLRYLAGAPAAMVVFGVSAARSEEPGASADAPPADGAAPAPAPADGAVPPEGVAPADSAAPTEAYQCVSHEDESMRITLNYVERSPYGAEKDCRNCEFWFWGETAAACGGCTLIAGTIDPLAYCDAWALATTIAPPPA